MNQTLNVTLAQKGREIEKYKDSKKDIQIQKSKCNKIKKTKSLSYSKKKTKKFHDTS